MQQAQGALLLNVAYIGVVNGLFTTLAELGQADAKQLAKAADKDPGYVTRWCDSAYAFQLIDEAGEGVFTLTDMGHAFRPDVADTLMPFAVQSVLSAHMAERAAGLMPSGERPGEQVLAERETVLPWFGPMLEHLFGPLLEQHILPHVSAFAEIDQQKGMVVDLGCGNGWYLRHLAKQFSNLRGIGLDGFAENIKQATQCAATEGLADRLSFKTGDIHNFTVGKPVELIAMNRALHHVWDDKENVFKMFKEHLKPGGVAIIWEPNWPTQHKTLREIGHRPMAFQNLAEHVQGNHFLTPDEIAEQFHKVGMETQVYLFAEDREAVVVGKRE